MNIKVGVSPENSGKLPAGCSESGTGEKIGLRRRKPLFSLNMRRLIYIFTAKGK
ncbi:MAG: hypothetical protein Q7U86_10075 [Draconibacterium sp.]|nr:hypothetical protein [Draconibacterium sp.]